MKTIKTAILSTGLALGMAVSTAFAVDITIGGDVIQLCAADKKGVCNMTYAFTEEHVKNFISIHGNVKQVCAADTGGKCNMNGTVYEAKDSCKQFQDDFVACY